jgi:exopolyphosphatase/guanosine-5'-triphosphate,3'-diphosphate pyrophosphatase
MNEDSRLPAFRGLAARLDPDPAHARHVAFLSERLFDQTRRLHGLGTEARFLLSAAAHVHGIGRSEGERAFHLSTQRIVLDSDFSSLSDREREIVALTARYHHGAEPSHEDDVFCDLDPADRVIVTRLASILRIADALDVQHRGVVMDLIVEIEPAAVCVRVETLGSPAEAIKRAEQKSALFETTFGVALRFVPK